MLASCVGQAPSLTPDDDTYGAEPDADDGDVSMEPPDDSHHEDANDAAGGEDADGEDAADDAAPADHEGAAAASDDASAEPGLSEDPANSFGLLDSSAEH